MNKKNNKGFGNSRTPESTNSRLARTATEVAKEAGGNLREAWGELYDLFDGTDCDGLFVRIEASDFNAGRIDRVQILHTKYDSPEDRDRRTAEIERKSRRSETVVKCSETFPAKNFRKDAADILSSSATSLNLSERYDDPDFEPNISEKETRLFAIAVVSLIKRLRRYHIECLAADGLEPTEEGWHLFGFTWMPWKQQVRMQHCLEAGSTTRLLVQNTCLRQEVNAQMAMNIPMADLILDLRDWGRWSSPYLGYPAIAQCISGRNLSPNYFIV